jgi:putative transposase
LTPSRRRVAAVHVQGVLGVSERRACGVLGQPRHTQRYVPRRRDDEAKLVARMLELVAHHPRYGYRRVWALLVREGWRVNRKRVWRLWKWQGLKVPQKRRKRRRLGSSANGCVRKRAEGKDDVWAWDFIFDRTAEGRSIKWLSVIDEFTRECLVLEVNRTMKASDVVDVLIDLAALRGTPRHIRSDNGPEFIAWAIRSWLGGAKVKTLYIEPGSPWENGYAESFHSRLRDELLDVEVFLSVAEARALALAWRLEYNHRRPHSSLNYQTPAAFAASCVKKAGGVPPTIECSPPEDTAANAPLSSDGREPARLS